MVGENGRVWVDGSSDGIAWTRNALQRVTNEGHKTDFDALMAELEQLNKGDA